MNLVTWAIINNFSHMTERFLEKQAFLHFSQINYQISFLSNFLNLILLLLNDHNTFKRRYDSQHNELIGDSQHKRNSAKLYWVPSDVTLSVAFILFCWVSLCWVSLCWGLQSHLSHTFCVFARYKTPQWSLNKKMCKSKIMDGLK